jgi:hypothetical protein
MDTPTMKALEQLHHYLVNLPTGLPLPDQGKSQYSFESFALDTDWVEDVGEEGAINRELEIHLGSRAKGPIQLVERGPGICALHDVLRDSLGKYPTSAILKKWLSDVVQSARTACEVRNHVSTLAGVRYAT